VDDAAAIAARGGFTTFVGSTLSLLIRAAGGILVARMLSPSEYGLFAIVLVAPGLFGVFSDWGVNSALTRFTARYRAEGKPWRVRELVRVSFLFKLAVGGALSLALFLSADLLAAFMLNRPEIGGFVRMVSLIILSQSIYNTSLSVLAGMELMDRRAMVNISQSVVKGICSPILVYIGLGVSGAIIGYVLSYAVAASVGFILTFSSTQERSTQFEEKSGFQDTLRIMMVFGSPLFLGGLIGGLVGRFRSILLTWFASNDMIGNLNVASQFTVLVGLVTNSIGIALYPIFSKFNHSMEPEKTRAAFRSSVRYSTMIVLPYVALIAALSKPGIYTLFSEKYPQAPLYLSLLMIPQLLVGLGSLSIGLFLYSQGDTKTSLKIGAINSGISLLLSPFFIWKWGVEGLITSGIVLSLTGNFMGLYVLHKKYSISPDLRHTWRTLLCSAFSVGLAYGVVRLLPSLTKLLILFIGSGVFLAAHLVLAPVTGALEKRDIENLDLMLRELRIIYPLARLLLGLEEKIMRLMTRYAK